MNLIILLAALFLFNASSLGAEDSWSAEKWITAATPHFKLHTSEGRKSARRAILHFEQVRAFFTQVMQAEPSQKPVTIIAFRSAKEFKAFQPKEFADAFFQPDRARDFIVMRSLDGSADHAAVHEYVHLLLHQSGLKIPLWFNEGLAELYGTLRPTGKKVRVGDVISGHAQQLQRGGWMPLEVLLQVSHGSPEYEQEELAHSFYAQSWFLVHMLSLSPEYRPQFAKFIVPFFQGRPAAECFLNVYGKTVPDVDRDLRDYRRARLRYALYDIKLAKSALEPEIGPADPADTGLALARVLTLNQSPESEERAERLYAQLIEQYPRDWRFAEALGYRALGQRDQAGAADYFAQAAALGSTNAQMYFDAAMLAVSQQRPGSESVALLEQAVKLQPDHVDACYYLALSLVREREYRKALPYLIRLKKVPPDRAFYYFRALSLAYHETGNEEQALIAARRACKQARSESEKESGEQLIAYLQARNAPPRMTAAASVPTHPRVAPPDAPAPPPQRPEDQASEWFQKNTRPESSRRVEGQLRAIDCLGKIARLVIESGGKMIRLGIYEPSQVRIMGTNGAAVEVNCGPQSRPIAVGYEPMVDEALGTVGSVTVIEFPDS